MKNGKKGTIMKRCFTSLTALLCSAAILLLIAGLAAAEWYKRKKR